MLKKTLTLWLIIATVAFATASAQAQPAEANDEDIWSGQRQRMRDRDVSPEQRIDRMLERMAERDPERARELRQLREEDPEAFRQELRETFRKFRERAGRRSGDRVDGELSQGRPGPRRPERVRQGGMPGSPGRSPLLGLREKSEEFAGWLEENYPTEAAELEELQAENPHAYRRMLMAKWKKYGRIMRTSEDDPELAEVLKEDLTLKREQRELLVRYRDALTEQEREEIEAELEDILSERFDLIIEQKQLTHELIRERIEELQQRLEEKQEQLDQWQDNKDEKVQQRLNELLSQESEFDWN